MRHAHAVAFAAVATSLLLTACEKPPAGPVAATVDGETITVAQLEAELKAAGAPDTANPQVRQAALERAIARKLLAKEAKDKKLDTLGDGPMLKQAAMETFQAGLAQKAAVDAVKTPTAAAVQTYIDGHPAQFAKRTLYLIEQIQLQQRPDPALGQALEPANTLEAVAEVLRARGVPFRTGVQEADGLRLPPAIATQLLNLPQGALFVLPAGAGLSINRVRASRPQPVAGEEAVKLATDMMLAEQREAAANGKVKSLYDATKAKITYGEGFSAPKEEPAKPAAGS